MGRTRKERTVRTHSFTILLKHCFSDHPLTYMGRTRKECTVRTHPFTSLLKHYFGDTYNYYTTVIEHRGSTSDRNRSQNIPDKTFLENHISDRDMIKLWGTMQHTHHNIGWVLDKMLLVHKYRKRRRQDPFWHDAIKKMSIATSVTVTHSKCQVCAHFIILSDLARVLTKQKTRSFV